MVVSKELGPYLLNKDGSKLIENPHSWNNNASVVFIESPAGVGFSYATDGNVATNDNIAADDNYLAIKQFFKKYPKFLKNDIYITGESYAGIYLPMLTSLIVKGMSKFKINLKGLAIGNPYLNKKIDYESNLIYAYGHGVVDEELWQSVKKDCCKGCVDGCDIEKLVGSCSTNAIQIYNSFFNGNINAYDIYRNCGNSPNASSYQKYDMFSRADFRLKNMAKLAKKARLNIMEEDTRRVKRDDGSSFDPSLVPCLAVMKALHIPVSQNIRWSFCTDSVSSVNGYQIIQVRGVGHMVPQWAPARAEYIIKQFMNNLPI
uniref:Carboxypeptidase n=1 Tax=Meloidogyne javanica TaxID=6303 RepID=A0A915M806_MELJA